MKLQIIAQQKDRTLTLYLQGELDHHAARTVMRQVYEEMEYRAPYTLVLDFSGVTFMDSSGIAVVLKAQQQMKQTGGRLTVRRPTAESEKVFRAAGLEQIVAME